MKYSKSSGLGLLSLLAALAIAPLAQARDAEPIARTKPVIDQPLAHKQAMHRSHEAHHKTHGAQHQHRD